MPLRRSFEPAARSAYLFAYRPAFEQTADILVGIHPAVLIYCACFFSKAHRRQTVILRNDYVSRGNMVRYVEIRRIRALRHHNRLCGAYVKVMRTVAYYQTIGRLSVKPVTEPLHLVYSPLNGTGNVPVREIMKRIKNIQVEIVTEQEKPDGRFPTCPYPNPEIREAMELTIRKTIETGADFCFATDPDCDRMGAGVRNGNEVQLISGNDMGILMLDFLCRNKKANNPLPPVVVKTIVTTEMAAALCGRHGIELRNVLTGFKFIGEQIGLLEKENAADRFLFGFEESYGYLSGTDVRDKDAVNAALLLCEMASDLKAQGKTMLDRLQELRSEYGFLHSALRPSNTKEKTARSTWPPL